MTHNRYWGYFGNLHINLDPIKFWHILFSKCKKMLFYYCVLRYKCTYMFKNIVQLGHALGPTFFQLINFGLQIKLNSLSHLLYISAKGEGGLPISHISLSHFHFFLSFFSQLSQEDSRKKKKKEVSKGRDWRLAHPRRLLELAWWVWSSNQF